MNDRSLQEQAKKILPFVQAAAEGKILIFAPRGLNEKIIKITLETSETEGICASDSIAIIEPPAYRPWRSVEEMGEAVNHWFRIKTVPDCHLKISSFSHWEIKFFDLDEGTTIKNLVHWEHTATPWLADSWKPCGVEEKEAGQ